MKEFTLHFPFGRHDKVKPPETPSAKNSLAVREKLTGIINRLQPGDDFSEVIPVDLVLGDNSPIQAYLEYDAIYRPGSMYTSIELKLRLLKAQAATSSDEIAHRNWTFFVPEKYPFREIQVTSSSHTRETWEGNGFGTALIMQSHDVIKHGIKRFGSALGTRSIKGIIIDASAGQMIDRTKWTTRMAGRLGYKCKGGDTFEKKYR